MIVLGIETSCDETGIALYSSDKGLLAHRIYSQIAVHAEYGGVVPELASRDHVRKVLPLIDEVVEAANIGVSDIGGIAYTAGPGLVGALMVGASIGRSLAWAWDVPAVAVHHMEGHLLAPLLEDNPPEFPFVALLVSGGHTQLVKVDGIGEYELLGESLDDAAGEAFDKVAKMLDLDYPGGPEVAKMALDGNEGVFKFPRPMTDRPGLDFSFSGLKTAVLNAVKAHTVDGPLPAPQTMADIALGFEIAVAETMVIKCRRAIEQTGYKTLVMAGGVSANKRLRAKLEEQLSKKGAKVYYPRHEFCTDNGAMIAFAGWQRLRGGERASLDMSVRSRWPLSELTPPSVQA